MHFSFLRHGVPFTCYDHGVQTDRPVGGCFLETRRFSRQEPGPADLVASAAAANFPHVVVVVLRHRSVSPFTDWRMPFGGCRSADAVLLLRICCSPQKGGDSGGLLLTVAFPVPFHLWLIGTDYRTSDDVEPHRFVSGPFSSGGCMHHPFGSPFATVL